MFDIEVIVPVCSRFSQRIEDFKRYGLVNVGSRSVLLNLIVSNESIEGLESGWPDGFDVRVVQNESPNHVANLYKFYTSIIPDSPNARWLIRLDDDSCTDVDGLVSNLDSFYDWERNFYLGELNRFHAARCGGEHVPYQHYKGMLGRFESIVDLMQNEIECGIMSASAVSTMMSHEPSRLLLHKRASLEGGFGDCVVALASAMAGVWPVDCPFLTHLPLVHDFSIFGGVKNHIHQISRVPEGENFWGRATPECFKLLTRAIEDDPSEVEKSLAGKRFLLESDDCVRLVEFQKGYVARIKLDHKRFNWYQEGDKILLLDATEIIHRFQVSESGALSCDGFSVKEI